MAESCDPTLEERVLQAGRQAVLAIAGGGAAAIGRLLGVPGASKTVLEAVAPQAERALAEWLGGAPERACDEATARAMAMASWRRARRLASPEVAPEDLVGVGSTAALATDRPKRGPHRVHVATQTLAETLVVSIDLEKGGRERVEEEAVATQTILATLADAAGARPIDLRKTPPGMTAEVRRQAAGAGWADLLAGRRDRVSIGAPTDAEPPRLLLPGSFNPPHRGHEQIAQIAAKRLGAPAVHELAVTNVDKPPLDYVAIADRLATLGDEAVWLTTAPTFVQKARLAPGCVFAIGADTAVRLADPRYADDNPEQRDRQFEEIGSLGCRFLVFGRVIDGRFTTLDELGLPAGLAKLCEGVSADEFREDVSSTALRESGPTATTG